MEFKTEASKDYLIHLRVEDAEGNTVDEFESGFPPVEAGAPAYFSALSNGPYTVTIETETERESFE